MVSYRKPHAQNIFYRLRCGEYHNILSSTYRTVRYGVPYRTVLYTRLSRCEFRMLFSSILQWSFGVTLWELTTLGQQPYVEVDPFEVEHYLKDGYRLSQPVNCPDEL